MSLRLVYSFMKLSRTFQKNVYEYLEHINLKSKVKTCIKRDVFLLTICTDDVMFLTKQNIQMNKVICHIHYIFIESPFLKKRI